MPDAEPDSAMIEAWLAGELSAKDGAALERWFEENPESLPTEGYGPEAQARRILQVLRERDNQTDDRGPFTFVGHSIGGTVVLRALGSPALSIEYPDVLERVESAVLLAPLDIAVERIPADFVTVAELPGPLLGIARMFGMVKRKTARIALASTNDPSHATHLEADRLRSILINRERRRSAQAVLRQTVPYSPETRRPTWNKIEQLVADYQSVTPRVLIIWGERDEVLPLSMGYKLQRQLPNAQLRVIEKSKHALPSERPAIVASLLREFIEQVESAEVVADRITLNPDADSPLAAN